MNGFWRALGIVALVAQLSGCGTTAGPDQVQRLTSLVVDGVSNSRSAAPDAAATLNEGAGVLMVQRVTGGQTAGLGLLARNNGVETWSTLDGITLTLQDGMIIGTAGLGPDLFSVDVDPVRARPLGAGAPRIHRYVDGENHLKITAFLCRISVDRAAKLELQGRVIDVSAFAEACSGPDHRFENRYVYSKSGHLLASRQWIGPEIGYFALEMPTN